MAALLFAAEADAQDAHFCGGTVLNHSWVLTAAHCVQQLDPLTLQPTGFTSPGDIDVLTGTQDLTSGGQRLRSVTVRAHPAWNPSTFQNDLALIRLDDPTTVDRFMKLPPGSIDPSTDAVPSSGSGLILGFGATDPRPSVCCTSSTSLLQASVQLVDDSACAEAHPGGGGSRAVHLSSMFCAGGGAPDTCPGDGGGPLAAPGGSPGGRIQWGVASWRTTGDRDLCAIGEPSVYTRVPPFVSWINSNIRYGPHSSASDLSRQVLIDVRGRIPSLNEVDDGRRLITGGVLVEDYVNRLLEDFRTQEVAETARLYRAAFARDADFAGLRYWVDRRRAGWTLLRVAEFFASSAELQDRYGTLSNRQFVEQLYLNVLGRPGEQAGVDYWTGRLDAGSMTRGAVLRSFSISGEYITSTKPTVDVIVVHFTMLRRLPTPAELSTWVGQPKLSLIKSVIYSFEYADRF